MTIFLCCAVCLERIISRLPPDTGILVLRFFHGYRAIILKFCFGLVCPFCSFFSGTHNRMGQQCREFYALCCKGLELERGTKSSPRHHLSSAFIIDRIWSARCMTTCSVMKSMTEKREASNFLYILPRLREGKALYVRDKLEVTFMHKRLSERESSLKFCSSHRNVDRLQAKQPKSIKTAKLLRVDRIDSIFFVRATQNSSSRASLLRSPRLYQSGAKANRRKKEDSENTFFACQIYGFLWCNYRKEEGTTIKAK